MASPFVRYMARSPLNCVLRFGFPQAVNMPFPGYNIHLVNEAYGIPPGWLQSSLYRSVYRQEKRNSQQTNKT